MDSQPMTSWLPVQRWLYTEALAAEDMAEDAPGMGDMGQATGPVGTVVMPSGDVVSAGQLVGACGRGFVLAGLAGWCAARYGLAPALLGAGAAYLVLSSKGQP